MRSELYVVVALALASAAASAADGVREINQADLEAGGGFPFVINQAGSYVLTGSLTVSEEGVDAIQVLSDNVKIDLNGFVIRGPGTGSGDGITALDLRIERSRDNIDVRNGAVRGFETGISLGSGTVERVRAWNNSEDGIVVFNGTVRRCYAQGNGEVGIVAAVATENVAIMNGRTNIRVRGSSARRNVVADAPRAILVAAGPDPILVQENSITAGADDVAIEVSQPGEGRVSLGRNVIQRTVSGAVLGDCNVLLGQALCPEQAGE